MPAYTVSQKAPAPWSIHSALVCVHFQAQARFQEVGHAGHDPFTGSFAANVDITVIRVTAEPVSPALQFPIQFGQEHVGEQG